MNNSKTMNNIFSWILILVASVGLISCTKEAFDEVAVDSEVSSVVVIGPDDILLEGVSTKGTEITPSDVLRFSWALGDTLGIFPNKGNQVEFPISSTEGGTSAVFNGGGWALKNNASYSAYYPYSVWNYHRNNQKILLDYSGQVQEGNSSYAHLSAYDYLASSKTTPMNSEVTFQMNRQGSILYIDIPVPVPCKVNSLVVSCEEAIFTEQAALDISGDTPAVIPIKMTKDLTLAFNNVETTEANENVRAYMAVSPVNFTDKTVTATLNTDHGPYSATVVSREVLKGKAAFLRFTEDFAPLKNNVIYYTSSDGDIITPYATNVFGASIVSNEYIDGQGILTFNGEVISIGGSAFYDCDRLTSVVIPESATSIASAAFYGCTSLTSVVIPGSVSSIGGDAFSLCSSLISISLGDGVTEIKRYAFSSCKGLTSITIPESITSIGEYAFTLCTNLTSFTVLATTPPDLGSNVFYMANKPIIYVPASSVETYKNASRWSNHADRIQAIVPIPEAIDLGLSVKWASFNVGASKPEEYGNYYAWGETKAYGEEDFTNDNNYAYNSYSSYIKNVFYLETYKWCNGRETSLTKYCDKAEYGYNGFVDNKVTLEIEDDAAHVNWGDKWRMPTKIEFEELINDSNCSWVLVTINGVDGYKVTSKIEGFTNKFIFLPFAGSRAQNNYSDSGDKGKYATSSLYSSKNEENPSPFGNEQPDKFWSFWVCRESMGSSGTHFANMTYRECGFSVRPVWDDNL